MPRWRVPQGWLARNERVLAAAQRQSRWAMSEKREMNDEGCPEGH